MFISHRGISRRIVTFLSLVLLITGSLAHSQISAAPVVDEQFQVENPPGPGYTGYLVNNTRSLTRFYSFLATFKIEKGQITGMKACSSIGECPNQFDKQVADVNLTMCNNALEENCIREIRTTNLLTKKVSNIFTVRKELTQDFNAVIKGNPSADLPNGGNPLVVSIPAAPHEGGNLYLIKSDYYATRNSAKEKFKLDLITNGIYPITVEKGNFGAGGPNLDPQNYKGKQVSSGMSKIDPPYLSGRVPDARCLMATKTVCLVPQAFPPNISFGLTLRANQGFTSWLYGRLANPSVSIERAKVDEKASLIKIDAEPVKVPVVYGWVPTTTLPTSLMSSYEKNRSGGLYVGNDRGAPLETISILKGQSNNYEESGIDEMLAWMPLLADKAKAMPSQWSFQTLTLKSDTASKLAACTTTANSLAGLVFTNATVFSSGAPSFDASSGTLDYRVAAPHLKPDGSDMTGSYDLILNSTVARCLYGFTNAPIGATVSVVNNEGGLQVATTVISEKDGFFRMGAYGFGFSSPLIKMKITQSAQASTQTITCVKGTLTKKVTGSSPTCPAGYKKK